VLQIAHLLDGEPAGGSSHMLLTRRALRLVLARDSSETRIVPSQSETAVKESEPADSQGRPKLKSPFESGRLAGGLNRSTRAIVVF
jgi:hypothetical protein